MSETDPDEGPGGQGLTPKQARFVEEYLKDLNATQAAIRAGYEPNSADVTGCRLLGNAKVASSIASAQAARSKRTQIDADWVLRRLAEEVEADLADLYTEDMRLKPVQEWPKVWRKGLVSGLKVAEMWEGSGETRRVVGEMREVKLSDRIKRLELIGKHVAVQAFKDRVEHEGGINLTVLQEDAEL